MDINSAQRKTIFLNSYEMEAWLKEESHKMTTCGNLLHLAESTTALNALQEIRVDVEIKDKSYRTLPQLIRGVEKDTRTKYAAKFFKGSELLLNNWIRGASVSSKFNSDFIETQRPSNVWSQALAEIRLMGISRNALNLDMNMVSLDDAYGNKKSEALSELLAQFSSETNCRPIDKICNFSKILSAYKICSATNGEAHSFFTMLSAMGWKTSNELEKQLAISKIVSFATEQ